MSSLENRIDTNVLKLNGALEDAVLELDKQWTSDDTQRENESLNDYYIRVMPKSAYFFDLMQTIGSQIMNSLQKIKMAKVHGHDVDETISKLEKDIKFHKDSIDKSEKLLTNSNFLSKAKDEVVKKEKDKLQENIQNKIHKEELLENLKGFL